MITGNSTYKRVINFSILLALIVIVLGAYARLTDSGLGCPDWPGCYGNIGVPDDATGSGFERPLEVGKAWKEMIHRYVAGTLGLLILFILFMTIKGRKTIQQSAGLPLLITATVIFQAALGMWTVTMLLSPLIVTAHLIGGFTTISLLWLLRLNQNPIAVLNISGIGVVKFLTIFGFSLVVAQIILGGWVSTNYAALACNVEFPTCHKSWLPEMDFSNGFDLSHVNGKDYEFGVLEGPARTAIHYTHRIGALIVFLYLCAFNFILIKKGGNKLKSNGLKKLAIILLVVLFAQISLGIMNVVLALPLYVAVLHNLFAALLLLTMLAIAHRIFRSKS